MGSVNEAHNGFLEVYLSMGGIGLALLGLILLASYRRLAKELAVSPTSASLGLSMWSIMIVYNLTEAAFPASLLWVLFLICAIAVPLSAAEVPSRRVQTATASEASHITVSDVARPRPRAGLAGLRVHRTLKQGDRARRRPFASRRSGTSSK